MRISSFDVLSLVVKHCKIQGVCCVIQLHVHCLFVFKRRTFLSVAGETDILSFVAKNCAVQGVDCVKRLHVHCVQKN